MFLRKFLALLFCLPVFSAYSLANVVINEVMYNPVSASAGHQWIELYNNKESAVSLQGWKLQTAGAEFSTILVFPDLKIEPYSYLLLGGEYVEGADFYTELTLPDSNNITSGVRLLAPSGCTDTVLYGSPNTYKLPDDVSQPAGEFAPLTPTGYSLSRLSDGYDTDNSEHDWIANPFPTPGYGNVYPVDLALADLQVTEMNDRIRISVKVLNPSPVAVPHNAASLRLFFNNECHGFYQLPELLPEYHSTETIHLDGIAEGYYPVEIRLLYQYDPDLSNNRAETAFIKGASPLILNELLFKQTAGNQEWVEIYNRSDKPIVMQDFYLEDAAATRTNFSGIIPPKTYMIICRHKQQFLEFYHYVSADLIIESTSWAILNNDRETLFIADRYGNIFDYTEYTAPASYPPDLSLERINPYDDDSLWDRCIHPKMSTPAAPNSRLPLSYDLSIAESGFQVEGNQLLHRVRVTNAGYLTIKEFFIRCFAYYNEKDTGVLLYESFLTFSGEETVTFYTAVPDADYTTFRYHIEAEQDLDPSNNYGFAYHHNRSLPVVVNEIMFRPQSGEPRWIELKVNSFFKYLFSVTLETERYIVDVPLSDREYIILVNNAADSLLIRDLFDVEDALIVTGLTSIYVAGEELKLYDPSGNIFEQFTYTSDWSKVRGVSAERVNPLLPSSDDNWAHSLHPAGATPGKQNSIFTQLIPSKTTLSLSPNPFSPYRNERTIISFELPERLNRVTCRIFDLKGRLLNQIVNQEIFAAQGTVIWDGKRDDGKTLPVGVYIIQLEAAGSDTEKIYREKTTVVIGK